MIEYSIKTQDGKIMDSYNEDEPTFKEASFIIFRLEELKLKLLDKEFKSDLEINED